MGQLLWLNSLLTVARGGLLARPRADYDTTPGVDTATIDVGIKAN